MKFTMGKLFAVTLTLVCIFAALPDHHADARAGGGRSYGSRGSRSYSPPSRSYSQPSMPRRDVNPSAPSPAFSPAGNSGGFLRSMAGGVVGGMLGGMLFRGMGFGGYGPGGFGGSGIGLFEIILIAGICYLIYRMVVKRRGEPAYNQSYRETAYHHPVNEASWQDQPEPADVAVGLSQIRQMDGTFDEGRFKDNVMDIFFRIQGAWMNRDISAASDLLTDEMRQNLQDDVNRLLREKRINRLENIAVRSVEISEAWQEAGYDFITALIYANLLDYTVDDSNGSVVSGSNVEPVKFEEYWTFTRPLGNKPWKLSAIDQK